MKRIDRLKNIVLKLNVAVLAFVVSLVVVEFAAWVCYHHLLNAGHLADRAVATDRAMSEFVWAEPHLTQASSLVEQFQPNYLWGFESHASPTLNVVSEWGGVRKTINPAKPGASQARRVFMFGGSTMFCKRSPDELTLASLVSRELNQRVADVHFQVTNFGQPAFVNDQEVVRLTRVLIDGGRPDIVVFYDGYNDTMTNVCLDIPHFRYEQFRATIQSRSKTPSLVEGLARYDFVHKVGEIYRDRSAMDRRIREQAGERARSNANRLARRYRNNLEFVRKLGEAYGFEVLCFWQPNLFTTKKTLTKEEAALQGGRNQKTRHIYQVSDQLIRKQLAETRNFHDISDSLDEASDSVFCDECHVSPVGNRLIATAIVDQLLRADVRPSETQTAKLKEESATTRR